MVLLKKKRHAFAGHALGVRKTMENEIHFYEHNSVEVLIARSSHTFPLHSHESFCFGIIEDGSVTFTIGGIRRELKKGMAFLIPPNVGIRIEADTAYQYVTVCLKDEWKEEVSRYSYRSYYMNLINIESIQEGYRHFIEEDSLQSAQDLFQRITQTMQPLMRKCENGQMTYEENDIVKNARTYMLRHAAERFSLEKTAEASHVSKYYLVKLFKRKMGVTPHQYFVQTKIRYAKRMLGMGKEELTVTSDLRFSDQSQLCNLFRKEMGISPGSYKKHYHAGTSGDGPVKRGQ